MTASIAAGALPRPDHAGRASPADSIGRIAGVILAGGAGKRIGGDKPLRPFLGKPLIEHVIDRARPQVGALWISARGNTQSLRRFALPIVEDETIAGAGGPLAGIVAALNRAVANRFDAVTIFPCDAPFVPLDLVDKLARTLQPSDAPGIVVSSSQGLQPTHGLWRVKAPAALRAAIEAGRLQLRLLCAELDVAFLDCRTAELDESDFFNINNEADIEAAKLAHSDRRSADRKRSLSRRDLS